MWFVSKTLTWSERWLNRSAATSPFIKMVLLHFSTSIFSISEIAKQAYTYTFTNVNKIFPMVNTDTINNNKITCYYC
jgi:hypothetical protein